MLNSIIDINELTSNFSSILGANIYLWEFGDNQTASTANPSHEYQQSGTYQVCLTVTNDCGSDILL